MRFLNGTRVPRKQGVPLMTSGSITIICSAFITLDSTLSRYHYASRPWQGLSVIKYTERPESRRSGWQFSAGDCQGGRLAAGDRLPLDWRGMEAWCCALGVKSFP